ncbi:MAG: class I SAM-dependent methyltransferase [Sedimentisphaerales bacterium]|nr:class I SAM-dependent methyltransferase [Sedimentisphaerales bacterium]
MIRKLFKSLYINGPLGTIWRVCTAAQNRFENVPGCKRLCTSIQHVLYRIQVSIDSRFDAIHGTDTSGVILLKDLDVQGENIKECNWYGPMPVKIFRRIMDHLPMDFHTYEFIDFGSGKGRVLLLASDYGFRRITGVEFAPELHRISARNVAILERDTRKPSRIETLCIDATEFVLPAIPAVLFFHSPFTGRVLERVLGNILTSFATCPREIVLIFYGTNSQSIDLLKGMRWPHRELSLRADWSRFTKFRTLIFTSPETPRVPASAGHRGTAKDLAETAGSLVGFPAS